MDIKDLDLSGFESAKTTGLEGGIEKCSRPQQVKIYTMFSKLNLCKDDFGIAKVSELSFIEASNLIQELDEMEKNSEMGILDEDDYYAEIGEDMPW